MNDLKSIFPKIPIIKTVADANLASEFHKRLAEYIVDFEKGLDESQEVGARLVSFGESITFHVENIGYYNPSLITFSGTNEHQKPIQLIQHVSQISFLLMALPRIDMDKPRIGFRLSADLNKQ